VSNPFEAILTTDVLIVGAGPTGMALSRTLAQAGVRHLIVDRQETGQNTSRAAVIHAHTLDALNEIGMAKPLWDAGLRLHRFSIRDRDAVLLGLRFDDLPSPYAGLLMLPQDQTEAILRDALSKAKVEVDWGWAVESLVEVEGGVEAELVSSQRRIRVRARYVVGADGMNSLVRDSAGIGFSGGTYDASFVLADVDMKWGHGREEVMLFFSPAGLVVVAPLPGGRFRIVATLEDAPEQPGVADVQALLDARGPTKRGGLVTAVHWSSRFRVHHRLAEHYRKGPFLLVGDAAHVHSPAGGQGMNTGLVDACVLGQLLVDVLCHHAGDAHLDQYEALRRPAAQQVLGLVGRMTSMATITNPIQRSLRNLVLRTLNRLPMVRRKFEMNLSGLARRAATTVRLPPGMAAR
jgi:2-polyprenyl-6-methoxyphenol hydroxylase-like FAD-dependent oxidoreductase